MSYAGELSGKRRYSGHVWSGRGQQEERRVGRPRAEAETSQRHLSSADLSQRAHMAKEVLEPSSAELGAGGRQGQPATNGIPTSSSSTVTTADGTRPAGVRQLDDIETARKALDPNRYATKKTIAQGMLDVALLTANASQLRYVLQVGDEHEFYTLMVTLISLSIILQCLQGVTNLALSRLDIRNTSPAHMRACKYLNHFTMALALGTVFCDAIRSGFGYDTTPTLEATGGQPS